ncbi:low molecular weight protein-tyrosine-phosphatase [Actinomyces sp.]|uniref:low molecular weight protein-tyrosine-phosphatase n=1 Tax=Actinomyces sp. TaxID=29317 RepID=UPI0026DACB58|nr:low molecular weight protein-tyrosine-phosphatase [Actinomyces sp.]MDO4900487.1 low molecular weight protein-tyrosine-phosphatase [Actinomyces sp.]
MNERPTADTGSLTPQLPAQHDPSEPYGVVMVCTGNICRSAMAHAVLVDRLTVAGLSAKCPGAVNVTSAGVSDEESGNPMDPRARRVLAEAGYGVGSDAASRAVAAVIATHAAHRIADAELRRADLILAMTAAHHRALTRRATRLGTDPERIRMFREFDPDAQHAATTSAPSPNLDVPDPWYGTMADFVDTLDVVERVSDTLAPALAQMAGRAGGR